MTFFFFEHATESRSHEATAGAALFVDGAKFSEDR